jgi:hypothetical protein
MKTGLNLWRTVGRRPIHLINECNSQIANTLLRDGEILCDNVLQDLNRVFKKRMNESPSEWNRMTSRHIRPKSRRIYGAILYYMARST